MAVFPAPSSHSFRSSGAATPSRAHGFTTVGSPSSAASDNAPVSAERLETSAPPRVWELTSPRPAGNPLPPAGRRPLLSAVSGPQAASASAGDGRR